MPGYREEKELERLEGAWECSLITHSKEETAACQGVDPYSDRRYRN